MEIISALLALTGNVIGFFFTVLAAVIVGLTMSAKGRNGLLWGIGALFFPWVVFFVFLIPAKVPKLHPSIRNHEAFRGLNPVVASIMALSAIVAKADGSVTKEEIQLVKKFVSQRFGVASTSLNNYEAAFNYGKTHPEDYKYFTELIRGYRRYDIITNVSYLFIGMAMQDGSVSSEEERVVKAITSALGLSDYEYQSIKRHMSSGGSQAGGYSHYSGGYNRGYNQYGGGSQMPREDLTKKYAQVLGVSPDDDMGTIKKAYRKLAKEHHPDKMASEGMPEDYMSYANERIAEINEAYDYLKKVKEAA